MHGQPHIRSPKISQFRTSISNVAGLNCVGQQTDGIIPCETRYLGGSRVLIEYLNGRVIPWRRLYIILGDKEESWTLLLYSGWLFIYNTKPRSLWSTAHVNLEIFRRWINRWKIHVKKGKIMSCRLLFCWVETWSNLADYSYSKTN